MAFDFKAATPDISIDANAFLFGADTQAAANPSIFQLSVIKAFMSDSPTLVTPTLGVAAGTSLALGGATIGTNALAVTGTALYSSSVSALSFVGTAGGSAWLSSTNGTMGFSAATNLQWSSTASATGTADLFVTRLGAGILRARAASSAAASFSLGVYTVATLPAAATIGAGSDAYVSDATATTARSTVAGGGANFVKVMCDGTNWLIVA